MLKYYDTAITFQEFPDEISLCVNIAHCPCHCPDCHSKFLWNNIGWELKESVIDELIQTHPDITCFGFMGGDRDHNEIIRFTKYIKSKYPKMKVGMYSGLDTTNPNLLNILDYYKIGHYDKNLGGLSSPKTNQKMIKNGETDITYRFNLRK